MVEAAISKMKTKPLVATGKFSIGELAAAMSRCQLIITNDSGPMHVAISQKSPSWPCMDRAILIFMDPIRKMPSLSKPFPLVMAAAAA